MSVNVGRKPGFQQRSRSTEPSVLIHRITDDIQIPTSGSYIRFADPREKPPKVFELHLRTNLPRSRCHGNCGKTNPATRTRRDVDEILWNNNVDRRENQSRKSKFGPQYRHFVGECLINYDTDKYCKPDDCRSSYFNFSG